MFEPVWMDPAKQTYNELKKAAEQSLLNRRKKKKAKASKAEGLFKQVHKCVQMLLANPRHPGLQTHPYSSLTHPYDPKKGKVFEAYVQQHTPGAYRLFWCYGPDKRQITVIAITPHP